MPSQTLLYYSHGVSASHSWHFWHAHMLFTQTGTWYCRTVCRYAQKLNRAPTTHTHTHAHKHTLARTLPLCTKLDSRTPHTHIHAYTHAYTHTGTHIVAVHKTWIAHTNTHVHIYTHTHTLACTLLICTKLDSCTPRVNVHIYTRTCTLARTFLLCTKVESRAHTHTRIDTHTHTHTYTNAHAYAWAFKNRLQPQWDLFALSRLRVLFSSSFHSVRGAQTG